MQFSEDTRPHYDAIQAAVQAVNQKSLVRKFKFVRSGLINLIRVIHNINDEIFKTLLNGGLLIADISLKMGTFTMKLVI